MRKFKNPVTIRIRAEARQRDLIDEAARQLGRRRSEFMLEAACRLADEVLCDQTRFAIDRERMAGFDAMLDEPPAVTDGLRKLLDAPRPWDVPR